MATGVSTGTHTKSCLMMRLPNWRSVTWPPCRSWTMQPQIPCSVPQSLCHHQLLLQEHQEHPNPSGDVSIASPLLHSAYLPQNLYIGRFGACQCAPGFLFHKFRVSMVLLTDICKDIVLFSMGFIAQADLFSFLFQMPHFAQAAVQQPRPGSWKALFFVSQGMALVRC